MYYLWKDKRSTEKKVIVYITDYKEISKDGKVTIDGYGYLEVELIYFDEIKTKVITFARKLL